MRWTLTWKPVTFLLVLGLTATLAACNGGGGDVTEPIEEPPAVEEPAEETEAEAEEEEGAEEEGAE